MDTGEDVVDPVSPAPAQLPWFRLAVGSTGWVLLLTSVNETRRMRDTGTPVALAREQRMSVMYLSVRTVFWAS